MDSALFQIVSSAQSSFASDRDLRAICTELLRSLLELTGAGYGLVARVDGATLALQASVRLRPGAAPEITRRAPAMDLSTGGLLTNVVLKGAPRVARGPVADLPPGAPRIANAVAMPFPTSARPVGLMFLANRRGGWGASDLEQLSPALDTCASLFSADDTQRRLAEREQVHRAVLDAVPDAVLTLDWSGRVVTANPAAHTILGLPELIGRPITDVVDSGTRAIAAALGRVDHQGTPPHEAIITSVVRDGRTTPLELRMRASGADVPLVAVVRDLSERDRLLREQQRVRSESDRVKSEFISIVSHELKTPLTAIQGSLGLLHGGAVDGPLQPAQQELVALALGNAARLVGLIDNVLDLERLTRHGLELRFERVSAAEVVGLAVETVRASLRTGRIDLRVELEPGLEVWADRRRLVQVITNLLSNAAKFSEAGEIVTVVGRVTPDGPLLGVRDTGAGVPPTQVARLFEPFAQADSSDTRSAGGVGLGLAICRSIIEQHGGRIGYEPTPEGGSFFSCVLPPAAPSGP